MIIDAHVHFWDPAARRHAWLDEEPALQRRFGPDDYDAGRHDVAGMVFVQADCRDEEALDEVRWVLELAARDSRVLGIVAYAPLQLGAGAAGALAAVAAQPGVVGIRRLLQDEPQVLAGDALLADGVRLLADHALPFDLCVRDHQLEAVDALVAACPEVVFVLDHLGKPAAHARRLDPWRADLARLAAHERVVCKLSGLATEAGPDCRAAELRPYVEHALEVFGPERCMVGSDWPVCTLATRPAAWFDLVLDVAAGLSPHERDAVLHGTARSVYGL
jgi:L-fuconolactonase